MILRIKSGMIRKEDVQDYSLTQYINGDLADFEKTIVTLTQDIKVSFLFFVISLDGKVNLRCQFRKKR
jgi:hypothetical protein